MSASGTYSLQGRVPKRFLWQSFPKAQTFLNQNLSRLLIPALRIPSSSIPLRETVVLRDAVASAGLRFFDLLDYLRITIPPAKKSLIEEQGFSFQNETCPMGKIYRHTQALFPVLILEEVRAEKASSVLEVGVKIEDLDHLKKIRGFKEPIRGDKESSFRKMSLIDPKGYTLTFVERKGNPPFEKGPVLKEDVEKVRKVRRIFGPYRDAHVRSLKNTGEGFKKTLALVQEAIGLVGKERAAYEWVQAEVLFWENRNKAATLQGRLQRDLGIGWANKDHITYRNSKAFFPKTIEILSYLGFEKREKLWAEEFTAQVMEHQALGLSAFVDVDPPHKKELGTVGLWVTIHGESMLSAGLHHVAARYDFTKVQEKLKKQGILFRPPFSYFDELKQVFTEGERRVISKADAKRLLHEGIITKAQQQEYITKGAVYSHLEDIQRGDGFKGFNQQSVDKTLWDTGKSLRFNKG